MSPVASLRRRWWLVLAAVAALAVAVVTLASVAERDEGIRPASSAESAGAAGESEEPTEPLPEVGPTPGAAPKCAGFARRAEKRAATVTGSGPRVVVIGDSWAVGRHVRPERTWPVYLDGEVHVDAFPGSALSARDVSRCGLVSYARRAPRAMVDGADLVVVQGSVNDAGRAPGQIRKGFGRLMETLEPYPTVVLAPHPTPNRDLAYLDSILGEAANKAGVPYVPTSDIEMTFLRDRIHPDLAGHRAYGQGVADKLRDRGLI